MDSARVRASYPEQEYRPLAALKAEWGPQNVFRSNVNIAPEPAVWTGAGRFVGDARP